MEELLERDDVEAVLITTPPDTHAALVEAAAGRGKHVFCEKPLAPSVEEAGARWRRASAPACSCKWATTAASTRTSAPSATPCATAASGSRGCCGSHRATRSRPGRLPAAVGRPLPRHHEPRSRPRPLRARRGHRRGRRACGRAHRPERRRDRRRGHRDRLARLLERRARAIDNTRRSVYGYDQRLEVHGSAGLAQADNEHSSTATFADAQGFHTPPLPHFYLERYGAAFAG